MKEASDCPLALLSLLLLLLGSFGTPTGAIGEGGVLLPVRSRGPRVEAGAVRACDGAIARCGTSEEARRLAERQCGGGLPVA